MSQQHNRDQIIQIKTNFFHTTFKKNSTGLINVHIRDKCLHLLNLWIKKITFSFFFY